MKRLNLNETNPTIVNATIRKTQESTESLATTTADLQTTAATLQTTTTTLATTTAGLQTTTAGLQTSTTALQASTATLEAKVASLFPVSEYGALADGTTDDTAAIQAAIDAAEANKGGIVFFDVVGVYKITSTLTIQVGSVVLRGLGSDGFHGSGVAWGSAPTEIKWGGAVGGVMIRFAGPDSATTGPTLYSCGMDRIRINGNGVAAIGLETLSIWFSNFSDLACHGCTTTQYYLGAKTNGVNINDQASSLSNTFIRCNYQAGRDTLAPSANGFHLDCSTNGNQCYTRLQDCQGTNFGGNGYKLTSTDNCIFINCKAWNDYGGTENYGFDVGGTIAGSGAFNQSDHFIGCAWGPRKGIIFRGTEAGYSAAARDMVILSRDRNNACANPEFGTGCLIADYSARFDDATWTPVFTAQSGTLTSYTVTQKTYRKIGEEVWFSVTAQITNIGTGGGALICTLPVASRDDAIWIVNGINASGAFSLVGKIDPGSSGVSLWRYDNAFPVGSGDWIAVSGSYKVLG